VSVRADRRIDTWRTRGRLDTRFLGSSDGGARRHNGRSEGGEVLDRRRYGGRLPDGVGSRSLRRTASTSPETRTSVVPHARSENPFRPADLGRRAFLGLAAAGFLTACAPSPPERNTQGRPEVVPDGGSPGTPLPNPPATSAMGTTRADVVARYTGVVPVAFGLDVPGVVNRLPTMDRVIALTFDACGGARGSGHDAALIDVLRTTRTPATLFLNQRWVLAHPDLTAELAGDPLFELANHGTAHQPLSVTGASAYGIPGTAGPGEVFDEISGNRETLTAAIGTAPRYFRSGTAHYDDVAVRIARDVGETVVNFDVNGDAGATFDPQQVAAALQSASAGSIVIGHMNQPTSGTATGVATALPRLVAAGFRFVRLADYLG
jgi:peptidoglycan/xylan/chitin deacetylase (PgdA/CDA1 family)